MNNIENKKEFLLETIKIYNTVNKEQIEVFKETTITSSGVECYRDLKYYLYPVVQCVQLIKEIKSFDEYQKLASRTMPDLSEFYLNFKISDSTVVTANTMHMKFGITTELGEILDLYKKSFAYKKIFDKVNLIEEVCDIIWYLANSCTLHDSLLSSALDNIIYTGKNIPTFDYPTISNMIELHTDCNVAIEETRFLPIFIGNLVKSQEELLRGLTNNINKLLIRYPDKFNNVNAVNRNLSEERKQLEQ